MFESDGYRCHLCRRKTDPTKVAPHPRSPTIDHVIPLSKGGTHEPSNCRTACFHCNATKGDRGGGEQLLLIAV
ncbi:HNH endonuclease signature motif containing protein [Nocardia sp. NPDC019255]|uniref:HNH endonuclease n=1 Tax=Nocardia sp. NPDC019255 TaxID=3154591 RepID=UPI0033FF0DA7